MNPLTPRAAFLIEYLDLPSATDDPNAEWEKFQLQHLNNERLTGILSKSRQSGYSFIIAAEAVADGCLTPRTTSLFVSINQEEAAEKIRYGRQIVDSLDDEVKPGIVTDNKFELEFDNGSRLISLPCRPPRGKARANVYLDEYAHYPDDRKIYTAALPITTKGGRLRIGSTPMGAGGMFWEIFDQKIKPYPKYTRSLVPWWTVKALCHDLIAANQLAPHMLTEERVRLFGSERLQEIFDSMALEDFMQEYECAWVDESVAWITWDEIKRNQIDAQSGTLWYRQAKITGSNIEAAIAAIEEIALAIKEGIIEPVLTAGLDIGRKRDLSEFIATGKPTTLQRPYRLGLSLSQCKFEDQLTVYRKALDVLPITLLLIDQTGIGMQLAEDLNTKYGDRAQGVTFTNPNKELWAVNGKIQFQRGAAPIPLERELSYQIHSIKKKVTEANNVVFDTAGNEKHHADKFWALVLSHYAAKEDGPPPASASAERQTPHAPKPKSAWNR